MPTPAPPPLLNGTTQIFSFCNSLPDQFELVKNTIHNKLGLLLALESLENPKSEQEQIEKEDLSEFIFIPNPKNVIDQNRQSIETIAVTLVECFFVLLYTVIFSQT